jgi:death-on-curing protein
MNEEPKWATYDQVVAIHGRQLRRFGGAPGLRDDGMLRSALERPLNKWRYEQADLASLAAAYACGLAKNHAFVDGNKRAAFMTMVVFLRKNDVRFAPDQAHATAIMISLAAGEVSEQSLARWIRDNWPTPKAGERREETTSPGCTSIR